MQKLLCVLLALFMLLPLAAYMQREISRIFGHIALLMTCNDYLQLI